jgi:hypothetical protein
MTRLMTRYSAADLGRMRGGGAKGISRLLGIGDVRWPAGRLRSFPVGGKRQLGASRDDNCDP